MIITKPNSSKHSVLILVVTLQTVRTIPAQRSVRDCEKNLGWFSLGFLPTQGKKKSESKEKGGKKEALQKAKLIAQEHEILKSAVQCVYGSQGRERSKLQLHHLFFTITLITLVISQE